MVVLVGAQGAAFFTFAWAAIWIVIAAASNSVASGMGAGSDRQFTPLAASAAASSATTPSSPRAAGGTRRRVIRVFTKVITFEDTIIVGDLHVPHTDEGLRGRGPSSVRHTAESKRQEQCGKK